MASSNSFSSYFNLVELKIYEMNHKRKQNNKKNATRKFINLKSPKNYEII